MTLAEGLTIENVQAKELQPHPQNPRQGDIDTITASILANGWHGVLVAQAGSGYILVGNHRFMAAVKLYGELGPEEFTAKTGLLCDDEGPLFPTHMRAVDDRVAVRILLADNRAGDLATWDEAGLSNLLQTVIEDEAVLLKEQGKQEEEALQLSMEALGGTGFTAADFSAIEAGLKVEAPEKGSKGTPEETLEQYETTQLRQITLILDVWEYGPVIDTLTAIRERESLETNKDAVLKVLAKDKAGKDLFDRIAAEKERLDQDEDEADDDDSMEGEEVDGEA